MREQVLGFLIAWSTGEQRLDHEIDHLHNNKLAV